MTVTATDHLRMDLFFNSITGGCTNHKRGRVFLFCFVFSIFKISLTSHLYVLQIKGWKSSLVNKMKN